MTPELPPLPEVRLRASTPPPGESTQWDPAYFDIEDPGSGQKAGTIILRRNIPPDALPFFGHVSYDIHPRWQGRGLARKACEALKPLARELGFNRLWITCDETNIPSQRTCIRLGAKQAGSIQMPKNKGLRVGNLTRLLFLWDLKS